MRWVLWLAYTLFAGALLEGCALLAAPALMEGGSLVGDVGFAAPALTASSQITQSKLGAKMAALQAEAIKEQLRDQRAQKEQKATERAVTVGLIHEMASWEHDPLLADLAVWVKAGGDPQFALNFALKQSKEDEKQARAGAGAP